MVIVVHYKKSMAIFRSLAGMSLINSPCPGIDGKFATGFNNGGGHSFPEIYTD